PSSRRQAESPICRSVPGFMVFNASVLLEKCHVEPCESPKEVRMFEKPFRWDLSHRSHLGRLVAGEPAWSYPDFIESLLTCCAKILASGGDSDLIFVGRSPESIFDHLS